MGLMCIPAVLFAHLQEFSQPRVICSEQKLKPWRFHLLGSTFHLLRCSAASLGSRVSVCSIISGLCDQSFQMSKAFSSTSVTGRAQALLPTLAVQGPVLFVSPCAPWNAESQGRPRQSCCCPGKRLSCTSRSSVLVKTEQGTAASRLARYACARHSEWKYIWWLLCINRLLVLDRTVENLEAARKSWGFFRVSDVQRVNSSAL